MYIDLIQQYVSLTNKSSWKQSIIQQVFEHSNSIFIFSIFFVVELTKIEK